MRGLALNEGFNEGNYLRRLNRTDGYNGQCSEDDKAQISCCRIAGSPEGDDG